MKKVLNVLMYMPLTIVVAPYLYAVCSMLVLGTTDIYGNDPKSIGVDLLYKWCLYTPFIGMLSVVLLIPIIIFKVLFKREKIKDIKGIGVFGLTMLITIFLYHYDFGAYLNWFFD